MKYEFMVADPWHRDTGFAEETVDLLNTLGSAGWSVVHSFERTSAKRCQQCSRPFSDAMTRTVYVMQRVMPPGAL